MGTVQNFTRDQLRMELSEEGEVRTIRFFGKSMLRDPNEFILPVFLSALDDANRENKRLVLDFRELAYMNSSTLTPLIKILERARVEEGSITVLFRKNLKWQEISFSALVIFQTTDRRIEIKGEE